MPIAHRAAAIVSENTRKCPSPAVDTTRPPSAASSRSIRCAVRRENQLDKRLVALRIAAARHLALQIDRADDVGEQKRLQFGHARQTPDGLVTSVTSFFIRPLHQSSDFHDHGQRTV